MIKMKYLYCILICIATTSAVAAENPFGTGQHESKKSITKIAKSKQAKKADSCSNLPTRCADIADCADAQRALRCGMTRLDRDHDGVACDKDCQ
jgi:hypothetical protein